MKRRFAAATLFLSGALAFSASGFAGDAPKGKTGEELFKEHCAVCHPDGGNIVNPQKTLHKADRQKHGIKSSADIVKIMRNPGPGMQTFDRKSLPDADAKKIADYVLKTFK